MPEQVGQKDVTLQGRVVFGLNQIKNVTPKAATWVFRVILYAAAVANILIGTIDEIPPELKLIIGKYSVYAVTLTHSFTRMFGINVEPVSKS